MAEPRFPASLARHGSAPALLARDGSVLSFAELDARVAELAERLTGPRGLVAIEAEVSQQAIVGLLATWRAGHAAVMLAPDAALWDDFAARFRPEASWRPAGPRWRLTRDAARGGAKPHPELALLLATSGSTGRARMVRLSATAVDANARSIGRYLGLKVLPIGAGTKPTERTMPCPALDRTKRRNRSASGSAGLARA